MQETGKKKNLITRVLPDEILQKIFHTLPQSHRYVAPVSRVFRDVYMDASDGKRGTHRYCISSPSALILYLDEAHGQQHRHLEASRVAAGSGRIDLLEQIGLWNARTCAAAARRGHLKVLVWLRSRGCPWEGDTCRHAAGGGHLELLQWAVGSGCEWNRNVCYEAAKGGHLEVLRWARCVGFEWDKLTCSAAAGGGHLEVLRWSKENGCSWDKGTCKMAARFGHLEVLKWARECGKCEWDLQVCSEAADGGHLEVLKWAIENGCPYRGSLAESRVRRISDPDFIKWFRSNRILRRRSIAQ